MQSPEFKWKDEIMDGIGKLNIKKIESPYEISHIIKWEEEWYNLDLLVEAAKHLDDPVYHKKMLWKKSKQLKMNKFFSKEEEVKVHFYC